MTQWPLTRSWWELLWIYHLPVARASGSARTGRLCKVHGLGQDWGRNRQGCPAAHCAGRAVTQHAGRRPEEPQSSSWAILRLVDKQPPTKVGWPQSCREAGSRALWPLLNLG